MAMPPASGAAPVCDLHGVLCATARITPDCRLAQGKHRPRRCRVRKLLDGVDNSTPDEDADSVTVPCEIVGSLGALNDGLVAEALEHQDSDAPNVDLTIKARGS